MTSVENDLYLGGIGEFLDVLFKKGGFLNFHLSEVYNHIFYQYIYQQVWEVKLYLLQTFSFV